MATRTRTDWPPRQPAANLGNAKPLHIKFSKQNSYKLNQHFIRASYNRRLVLFPFTGEATAMRLRLTAIAIVLLQSSWALALTTTTTSFQKGDANGYNSLTELRISM